MKKKVLIKYISFMLVFMFATLMGGCSKKNTANDTSTVETQSAKSEKGVNDKNPIVTIEMENGKKIKLELYPEIAPNTVRNFVSLVQKGFYDGVVFHRVIPDFMIQGGDPKGTGSGSPGYSIKGEFKENKFKNDLKHDRGVLSMARTNDPDSAGSQFFIMVKNSPNLDDKYAAFGKVLEGMEEVDRIVAVKKNGKDKPVEDQKMKKVTVDTFGVKYNEPEKVK